jgi:DNA-binding transcriptional LysR family regulator
MVRECSRIRTRYGGAENNRAFKRIAPGMGWGHMPRHLTEPNLRDGSLLPITGRYFKGGQVELVAARRRNTPHGPIANRLWQFIGDQAARMIPAAN